MQFDLEHGIAVLERTPAALTALLGGLSDEWTDPNEGPETWSPFDVVGHLVDCEETNWMVRARLILGDTPDRRFEPLDRHRHREADVGRTMAERLARFATLRTANLAALRSFDLRPDALRRTAVHPEFGTVRLEQLLATWVVHDLAHLGQIARVMAKQYRAAVGPWEAYLSILRR